MTSARGQRIPTEPEGPARGPPRARRQSVSYRKDDHDPDDPSSARPNSLSARDAAFHFHGYTNARRTSRRGLRRHPARAPTSIPRTAKEYLDGLSALWCASLGFGKEQRLIDAAVRQMETLPFYHTFTQKTPAVTVELAEKLVKLARC